MTWLSRILSWIAALVVGGVFGVAGTIGHSYAIASIPVGLVVGAIACGAILIAIRALTHDRGATLAAGLGMLGMLTIVSGVGPGGSIVVPDTIWGRVWIYVVAGLVLLAIAWPRLPERPARKDVVVEAAAVPASGPDEPAVITSVPSSSTDAAPDRL